MPLHSIGNLRRTKIAVSWGATSPDQPFHFIRFLTEAEAGAGQIQFPASASFRFLILEAE
ncbi:MAG: hypothetical protein ACXW3Z_12805 [Limisphaerales bacterium]